MEQIKEILEYRDVLMREVALLRSRYTPEDTGHLRTTVSVLEERINELNDETRNEFKLSEST